MDFRKMVMMTRYERQQKGQDVKNRLLGSVGEARVISENDLRE